MTCVRPRMRLDISGRSLRGAGRSRSAWPCCSSRLRFGRTPRPVGRAVGPTSPDPAPLRVVTTTTILADLVAQVGRRRRSPCHSLVPKGGEVHTFDPTPVATSGASTEADLIVIERAGPRRLAGRARRDAGHDGAGRRAGRGPRGRRLPGRRRGRRRRRVNPHLWMNVALRARSTSSGSREALTAADPGRRRGLRGRRRGLRERARRPRRVGAERARRDPRGGPPVVSFHDAFPYFAAAYGLDDRRHDRRCPGPGSRAPARSPTSSTRSGTSGVEAIFAEAQFSDDLVRTIADETGATVVSRPVHDTLGDAPLDTYEG